MALPLPSVVSDVGPGGPLVTSMRGINALQSDMLGNRIKGVQAQYAPVTVPAEAASKLAYANLMGPQFLAKLMGNEDILANMSPEQRNRALQLVYSAGSGQGTGNAMINNPALAQQPQQNDSILGRFVGNIKNAFGMGAPSQQTPLQNVNAFNTQPNVSQQDRQAINGLQPGQAYTVQGNPNANADSGYAHDRYGRDIVASPAEVEAAANRYAQQPNNAPPPQTSPQGEGEFFTTAGQALGRKEQEKELGKIRANAIDDLDQTYQQTIQAEVPIKHLMDMSQSPTFINMRNQIPFFQDKQLQALSKIGTPEQQRMVGDFVTTTTNAVANTVNGFRGRILDKEITMANQMKVSPNDTWNTMIGKLSSIATFNEMLKQRSYLASQYIQKEHLNRGEALKKADERVNGTAIRQQVDNQLNPQPSEDDIKYMAQKYNTTPIEIKKKLNKKGYKLEIELQGGK